MHEPAFCAAAAFLDDQTTILGEWSACQYIALKLSDHDIGVNPPIDRDRLTPVLQQDAASGQARSNPWCHCFLGAAS